MLASGVCPRCIMRFLNVRDNSLLRKPESEIEKELLKRWPSFLSTVKTKGAVTTQTNGAENTEKLLHCTACFGMAQDFCLKQWVDMIADKIGQENFVFKSFKMTISQPLQLMLIEEHLNRKWADDLKSIRRGGKLLEIKDVVKIILEPQLEKRWSYNAKATTSNEAELLINLTMKHGESEADLLPKLEEKVPQCFANAKRQLEYERRKKPRKERTFYTLNSVRPAIAKLKDAGLEELLKEANYKDPMVLAEIKLTRASIYVAGRYCKFSRELSQTPWLIDGVRKSDTSVQEFIAEPIKAGYSADMYNFSSAGREDIDVRMLGNGRPFLVELINPRKFSPPPEDMQALQRQINAATTEIRVRDLQIVSKANSKRLKDGEEEKTKSYTAVCYVKIQKTSDPTEFKHQVDQMHKKIRDLSTNKDLKLNQKTPLRVLHRRNLAERQKCIHTMSAEIIDVTNAAKIVSLPDSIPKHYIFFKLDLMTQAGTYIKEFVHSDFGRTEPHIGTLLGTDADILSLDVNAVNLDWPSPVPDEDEDGV